MSSSDADRRVRVYLAYRPGRGVDDDVGVGGEVRRAPRDPEARNVYDTPR